MEKLIKTKLMEVPGLNKIMIAKQNEKWDKINPNNREYVLSEEIMLLIKSSPKAFDYYQSLSSALTRQYTAWIMSAAKPETQIRRANKLIESLQKGEKMNFM